METLRQFREFTGGLAATEVMPVLFMGHGSPMNGIEVNEFSEAWIDTAARIPQPKAVVVISAHWFTRGTRITAMDFPPTIHDFYGFPKSLFEVRYPAPGDPQLAQDTITMVRSASVIPDHDWGLDHGAWSVIRHMYPKANIPVLQLSIDYTKDGPYHYQLAAELSALRQKGVLLIGSGNMVHNLGMLNWEMINGGGYDWAIEMNEQFKKLISDREHQPLIHYEQFGVEGRLAIPTPEHYLPLLYTLGLQKENEEAILFNDKAVGGSLTMTSVQIG